MAYFSNAEVTNDEVIFDLLSQKGDIDRAIERRVGRKVLDAMPLENYNHEQILPNSLLNKSRNILNV